MIGALIVISIAFIMLGHVYREQIQLVLKRDIFVLPECHFDYWSLTHFLLFFLFGTIMPEHHMKFFALGVAWELFEDYLSSSDTTQLVDCRKRNGHFWCRGLENDYWYMCVWDPIANALGYMCGSAFATN